jgi:hypothetical protein
LETRSINMNKRDASITLRVGIAIALCVGFICTFPLRVSYASTVLSRAAADLKTESQFRSEGSRYEAAVRAIGGIATMKLETGAELKTALDILKRETPNLKFHRSRLVALSLSDSTLVSAAKRRAPDKQTAEAFVRELNADPQSVLKLNGAETLRSRLQRSREADAATLRRAAEKLKEAAERLQKASGVDTSPRPTPNKLKFIQASFSANQFAAQVDTVEAYYLDPVGLVVASILTAVFVAAVLYPIAFVLVLPIVELIVTKDPDGLAECQDGADGRLSRCLQDASTLPSGLPFFERERAAALCYVQRLQAEATCLLSN